MRTTTNHTIQLNGTDHVSIWEWRDHVRLIIKESQHPESNVEVENIGAEEFLRSCCYYVERLTTEKDLPSNKIDLLKRLVAACQTWQANQTEVSA